MSRGAALAQSRLVDVRSVSAARPLHWLTLGWRDLVCGPGAALAHGAVLAAFGLVLLAGAHDKFWLLAGAFSGFLLVAPVLATGLYAISRRFESGDRANLGTAFDAWRPRDGRLVAFGLLLALAGTGWVLTSAALITSFAGEPVRSPADFMRIVVLREQSMLFPAWLALGGVLAAPMFASSVIALPLLLDRRIGVLAAVLTSWRAVLANPVPLALWAALIMLLTLAGMATLMLGLVVVVPWLGHASWHAYRDLVDARQLPAAD